MTEQERIQKNLCRCCESAGQTLIHGSCRDCFNRTADAFAWAEAYYRSEGRGNQLSYVGTHLLAALKAIREWCGSDEGAQAIPYQPPWADQMQKALLLAEKSPVRFPKA